MLIEISDKGQVVIPVNIRKEFDMEIGDMLDVIVDRHEKCVKLKKAGGMKSTRLAGSLSQYKQKRRFPSKHKMAEALAEGIVRGN
jgi:AbrB family looped-hinge helix DNA binding protein